MQEETPRDGNAVTAVKRKLVLPEFKPPTEEELARWKQLAEDIDRLRAEIGPIDIRTDDLIHAARSSCQ